MDSWDLLLTEGFRLCFEVPADIITLRGKKSINVDLVVFPNVRGLHFSI